MVVPGQPGLNWLLSSGESRLSAAEVHVWQVEIDPLAGRVSQLAGFLSAAEQKRAGAFLRRVDRERFIIAHGILRTLLGRYLEVAPADLQFSQVIFEKPYLEGAFAESGLQFNLSHSQSSALFAFTRHRQVGVDIEAVRPLPDLEQIAAKTFSPLENEGLNSLPPEERLVAFYRCWTRKEAFVKALGSGLSYPLDRFSVSVSAEGSNCLLEVEENPAETLRWSIRDLEVVTGYAAALAVEGPAWRPVFWHYYPEE